MSENTRQDKEFSTGMVPVDQRRGIGQLVFTWIGYIFTVTIMSAGGVIAQDSTGFQEAMTAVFCGAGILFIIAMCISLIAMRTGLSFGLFSRFSFGAHGAKLVSLFTTVTLCGWFSINCYLIGDITHVLFPVIPGWITSIIFGVVVTFTALKGSKFMNIIGLFATFAVFAVGIVAIIIGFMDSFSVVDGGLLAIHNAEAGKTLTELITIAVGSVVCGCTTWAPDIMRFSKGKTTTAGTMIIGLGIAQPFMLVIGIIGTYVYNQYDIAYILQAQGFLPLAFIGLVANLWSTANGNAYSSSLNLASIFTKVKREHLLVIFGIAGTVVGLFGLYKYFSSWLSFLAATFPPMGGVVIADYLVSWRARTPDVNSPHLMKWNPCAFIGYAAGISLNWLLPSTFGITAVNTLVTSFVVTAILSAIFIRKRALRIHDLDGEAPVVD